MTFIITLIALLIERFFHWSHLRHWRWFTYYESKLGHYIRRWPAVLVLALYVLPPVIGVAAINILLSGWLFGIFKFIFNLIVMLYCLGPHNLWAQVYASITELHKEPSNAHAAINLTQQAFDMHPSEHRQAFHHRFIKAIFVSAHQRIFVVLFWFVILGPLGMVLYRLLELCSKQTSHVTKSAVYMLNLLDWPSIRLFTFLFTLAGHFTETFHCWKQRCFSGLSYNEKLLTDCGMAALHIVKEEKIPEEGSAEKAAIDLVDRAFIIGLVILAIIVLLI